jgi:hypothetical protein
MDDQEVEQENSLESRQSGGEIDDKKYLQLSISAFITSIIIVIGWLFANLGQSKCMFLNLNLYCSDWIKVVLLGISIIFGLLFLYKYKINDSKAEGLEWVNNLVESVYGAFPEIAIATPLIVGVIVVTQIIFTETHTTTTETPTPTMTPTPTIETPTPTIETPKPKPVVTGCVVTYGLNVRTTPGVLDSPSNHAKIWLRNDACMTILDTSTPEWAYVRFEGWVRLKKGETEYVIIVTPTAIPTPTPTP